MTIGGIMTNTETRNFLESICDLISDNIEQILSTRYEKALKADGTSVTTSDIFVEKLIHEHTLNYIPNVSFIGEESFDFKLFETDGYIAILDPIDGTENFASGLKEWGISFGLWKNKQHLGSLLLLPELELKLLTGDEIVPANSRIIGLSSSMSAELLKIMSEPGEYRITGCAVFNMYHVIQGSFAKFINPKGAYVWDIFPGLMLALEHGCNVIVEGEEFNGQFLDPTKRHRFEVIR